MSLAVAVALGRAGPILVKRLGELQARLETGEDLWAEYLGTVQALVALAQALRPENGGAMLTTKELAARLAVSPKTLLRHKADGKIRPAMERGKLLRWSGQERLG